MFEQLLNNEPEYDVFLHNALCDALGVNSSPRWAVGFIGRWLYSALLILKGVHKIDSLILENLKERFILGLWFRYVRASHELFVQSAGILEKNIDDGMHQMMHSILDSHELIATTDVATTIVERGAVRNILTPPNPDDMTPLRVFIGRALSLALAMWKYTRYSVIDRWEDRHHHAQRSWIYQELTRIQDDIDFVAGFRDIERGAIMQIWAYSYPVRRLLSEAEKMTPDMRKVFAMMDEAGEKCARIDAEDAEVELRELWLDVPRLVEVLGADTVVRAGNHCPKINLADVNAQTEFNSEWSRAFTATLDRLDAEYFEGLDHG